MGVHSVNGSPTSFNVSPAIDHRVQGCNHSPYSGLGQHGRLRRRQSINYAKHLEGAELYSCEASSALQVSLKNGGLILTEEKAKVIPIIKHY